MVKPTTKKNTKKPTRKSLSVLKIVLLASVAIVASLFVYNQTQLNNEKNSFMQLRSDFLSLQTEFNKVDPGWTYSESCNGKGGVYNDNEASNCSLTVYSSIKGKASKNKIDEYIQKINEILVPSNGAQLKIDGSFVKFKHSTSSNSYYAGCSSNFMDDTSYAFVQCSDSAHQFYFQRADR